MGANAPGTPSGARDLVAGRRDQILRFAQDEPCARSFKISINASTAAR
jgi:hypothetical protein